MVTNRKRRVRSFVEHAITLAIWSIWLWSAADVSFDFATGAWREWLVQSKLYVLMGSIVGAFPLFGVILLLVRNSSNDELRRAPSLEEPVSAMNETASSVFAWQASDLSRAQSSKRIDIDFLGEDLQSTITAVEIGSLTESEISCESVAVPNRIGARRSSALAAATGL